MPNCRPRPGPSSPGTRSSSAAPTVGSLGVSVRPDRLREWNLGNLNSYWLNLATTDAAYLADRDPAQPANAEVVAWCTLGAARLHYTLAIGDLTSKSGAGRDHARLFPRDHVGQALADMDADLHAPGPLRCRFHR
jgi:hypothetical protein